MPENISDRLKKIMSLRDLKQVDILNLAKPYCEKYNICLGKSDLSQFVNGKATPGQSKLAILGLALNVSESWLMGLDVPMERGATLCPVCGLFYADDFEPDVIEHQRQHNKFLAACKHFGRCYSTSEYEQIKGSAYKILHADTLGTGKEYSFLEKCDAATTLLVSYFSRSLWANDYNLAHPTFDEYASMLLYQNSWVSSLDEDIYNHLLYRYGKSPGIPEGKTIYHINSGTKNTQEPSLTMDEQDREILNLVRKLSYDQKDFLLALLQTLVLRAQGIPVTDRVLAGVGAPESEHLDLTR